MSMDIEKLNCPRTIHYAVAKGYCNNSNMYEVIKYVRKKYPEHIVVDDEAIEEIWDSIDAYVDLAT